MAQQLLTVGVTDTGLPPHVPRPTPQIVQTQLWTPDGDAGRTRRMRTVLTTLAQQYRSITLSGALSILDSVSGNLCRTNMTLDDMLKAVGYAMQVAGAEPEGLQMPADGTMQPIEYAGMSTRQVDFEACRQILAEFLDNSFVVADP